MPEIIPNHVPSPRTLLAWDGAAYRPVAIDALGRLNVNVLTNLGLDDALQSVATDRLIVRGEDQVFSYNQPVVKVLTAVISGADGFIASDSPPDGFVWVITNIGASDRTGVTTEHRYYMFDLVTQAQYFRSVLAFGVSEISFWGGHLYLEHDDVVRVYFIGGLVGDSCRIELVGYEMTKET